MRCKKYAEALLDGFVTDKRGHGGKMVLFLPLDIAEVACHAWNGSSHPVTMTSI